MVWKKFLLDQISLTITNAQKPKKAGRTNQKEQLKYIQGQIDTIRNFLGNK